MTNEFRLLVCGGRDYGYRYNEATQKKEEFNPEIEFLNHTLNSIYDAISGGPNPRRLVIIEGEQRGADILAKKWAEEKGLKVMKFPADWDKYNKRAGFIRNRQMLEEGAPHAVVAFPGGVGTRMMVGLAKKSGLPTKEYYPSWLTNSQK